MVVDASVLVDALGDDGEAGHAARRVMLTDRIMAPDFVDLEVLAAWRRQQLLGTLTEQRADLAVHDLRCAPIVRVSTEPLLSIIWRLRHNLTMYDASYVALAALYDVPFVTADRGAANAPNMPCEVRLLKRPG